MMDSKHDWDFKFTLEIWTYQNTYKVFIRTIFFFLKAILVIEFEVPALYIVINKKLDIF